MIPYSRQLIEEDDVRAVIQALNSDFITQGPVVERFEDALAAMCGRRYALVFNSATSALYSAYGSLDFPEGSEVVVPALTFVATANTAILNGLKVRVCDIDGSGNIDKISMLNSITPKTVAIVPVDFGGNPVDIDIYIEAKRLGLKIINDASHALGSMIEGRQCGFMSDISIFSFHAIKPITTGEGGAALTDDKELYERMKLIRSHGVIKREFWNSDTILPGFNFRMSDFSAALGLSQLKKLDRFIEARERLATFYDEYFKDNELIFTISIAEGKRSSRHLYPILLDRSLWCSKEEIFSYLRGRGIGVQVHYKPIYELSYYKRLYPNLSLKRAEDFYRAELSIPLHQGMSLDDAKFVADSIIEALNSAKGGCIR